MTQSWRRLRRRLRRRWRRLRRKLRRSGAELRATPKIDPLATLQRVMTSSTRRSSFSWAIRVRSPSSTVATMSTSDPISALQIVAEAVTDDTQIRPGWSILLEHLATGRHHALDPREVATWPQPVSVEAVEPLLARLDTDLAANLQSYTASSSTVQTVGPQREFVDIEQILRMALISPR